MSKIIRRRDALALGLKQYYTGKPCVNGHISERRASNGLCLECSKTPCFKERKKRNAKSYYERNRFDISEKSKIYYKENRDVVLDRVKRYREKNPEKIKELRKKIYARDPAAAKAAAKNDKHNRRAAKAGGVSNKELRIWQDKQQKVCYWCGEKCDKEYHIDHYEPLSKGGEHELDNLVIACPRCNLQKSAKDPLDFAKEVGRLF